MADPSLLLAVACGVLVVVGLLLVAMGIRGRTPRLSDALDLLDPAAGDGRETAARRDLRTSDDDLASRAGAWAFVRLRLPLSDRAREVLALKGRSIGDYFAEKFIYAAIGLVTPALVTALVQGTGHLVSAVPVVVCLVGGVAGWFWPDLVLERAGEVVRVDARASLHTYLDLVTLERLANASASQALMSAASLSESTLFRRIRSALDRARLEQRPPWAELKALSVQLRLPELADIADIMRLDEQGAALADTLRARVRELRDAHLMEEKVAAQKVSERMTVWMVVPSMVFGLSFLVPPILKLSGVSP